MADRGWRRSWEIILLNLRGDVVGDGLEADRDELNDDGRSNAEPTRHDEDKPEERVVKHPDKGTNERRRECSEWDRPPDSIEEEPEHGAEEQRSNNWLGKMLDFNGKLLARKNMIEKCCINNKYVLVHIVCDYTNLESDNKDKSDSHDARKLGEITCIESSSADLNSIRMAESSHAPTYVAKVQPNSQIGNKVDDGRVPCAEEKAVCELGKREKLVAWPGFVKLRDLHRHFVRHILLENTSSKNGQ